jgi:hypothetical protein
MIAMKYYWLGLEGDVEMYTASCTLYAKVKSFTHKLYREPQSLQTLTEP